MIQEIKLEDLKVFTIRKPRSVYVQNYRRTLLCWRITESA